MAQPCPHMYPSPSSVAVRDERELKKKKEKKGKKNNDSEYWVKSDGSFFFFFFFLNLNLNECTPRAQQKKNFSRTAAPSVCRRSPSSASISSLPPRAPLDVQHPRRFGFK